MGTESARPLLGGRYHLLQRLGAGHEAATWLATDGPGGAPCVAKIMNPGMIGDDAARAAFRNEAESLRAVAHPQLVPLLDIVLVPEHGIAALVMPRVPGEPLDQLVARGTLPVEDVAAILVDCARGLGALHQRKLLHRDLHPRNVVVSGKPGKRRAVIVDFGLVTGRTRDLRRTVSGTLGYIAPESILAGTADARSDLYSLGSLLYFMVVGQPPLEPRVLLDAIQKGQDPFTSAEGEVARIVAEPFGPLAGRLLARYPAARYQSAEEVVDAVNLRCGTRYEVESPETRRPALGEPPFFGRKGERRAGLRHLLRSLQGDGSGIAAVRGERGIGKSRLLAEAARAFEFRGVPVIAVDARGAGTGASGAFLAAVRSLRHRMDPARAALLDRAESAAATPGADAALRDCLVDLLRGVLEGPPRGLLVVDDADLLDPGSREVLARVLFDPPRRVRSALLSLSAPEEGAGSPDRARLSRLLTSDPDCQVTDLNPLPRPAHEDLVRSLLPVRNLAVDVVKRIVEAARGNPAATIEIVRSLMDGGRVAYSGGGWVLRRPGTPLPVPRTAAEAARRRLASLAPAARRALEVVALLGGAVPASAWPRVRPPAEGAADPLQDLLDRGFLRSVADGARLELASPDLAPALADGREGAARDAARRIAGEIAFTEESLDPAVRCRTLIAAGRPADAAFLAPAAIAALRREARSEAVLDLVRDLLAALRRSATPVRGSGWILAGADVAREMDRIDESAALVEEGLRAAVAPAERHALLTLSADLEAIRGRSPEALLQRLEAEGAAPEPTIRTRLAVARFRSVQGKGAEALAILGEILPGAEAFPYLKLRVLNGMSGLLAQSGQVAEARSHLLASLDLAREIGDAHAEVAILTNIARQELRAARFRQALLLAAAGSRTLSHSGTEAQEVSILRATVSALEGLGRWRTARSLAMTIVDLCAAGGDPADLTDAYRRNGRALGMLGRQEEAMRSLTRSLQVSEKAGLRKETEATLHELVSLSQDRGEWDRAGAILAEAAPPTSTGGLIRRALELRMQDAAAAATLGGIRDALASQQAKGQSGIVLLLHLLEVRALSVQGMAVEAQSRWSALLADTRRCGAVDFRAQCLALSGTVNAGDPAAAMRDMKRAVRLARRLHGILIRAEVLETCGKWFAGITGEESLGRECLAEAASLFGSASLPGRAETMDSLSRAAEAPTDWRGLRPEKLMWVLDRTEAINQVENPEDVLAALLDSAIAFTGAERGFLVLASGSGFEVRLSRTIETSEIGTPEGSLSASLVKTCIEEGKSILTSNAQDDDRFSSFFSVRELQLRSILVVPILRGARVIGAFYLDNRFLESVFSDQDRLALERFASQAALAFENVKYRAEVRDLARRLEGKVKEQSKELVTMRSTVSGIQKTAKYEYREIFRGSGSMAETLQIVDRAVESMVPVLLEGESGTGKELVARAIHFHGPFQGKPLVVVNCAAIPEALIESELFGHVKGAFTGAHADRVGKFEEADGGTLFLDEVGDLPLAVQPKFLRALQFGEIAPLGGGEPRRVQARIVAATNRDLKRMMEEGTFREDLYYRLAVFPIRLPALRERMEDIPEMATALVRRFSAEAGRGPRRLSSQGIARLLQHEWPGNVRELENVLRRAVLMAQGDVLGPEDLPLGNEAVQSPLPILGRLKTRVAESLKPRDELVLRRILDRGKITLREYQAATRVSKATATRDLRRLVGLRILVRRGSTAAASYELAPHLTGDPRMTKDAPKLTQARSQRS